MVDIIQNPNQTEPAASCDYQACGPSNQEINQAMTTMPPQPTDSWNRLYGQLQFRSVLDMYQKNWEQGQTRTKTLGILRSMCETTIQEDAMMMFQTHAMYFEEDTLSTNPHEDDFLSLQLAMMRGEIAPVSLTDV